MSTHDHLPILLVSGNDFQLKLLHYFFRDRDEANQPVVLQLTLLPLPEDNK